eukprot:5300520-Alexandrium_andersonii.AAC.1
MPPDDPPEQNRQGGRAQPEPEPNDAQNAQNESDFPKQIFVTASGERWHTYRGCVGLAKARTQPRPLTACKCCAPRWAVD